MEESTKRIIDASLNRASEATRVVEDICRFHLSNRSLSEEAKSIRHAIRNLPDKLGVKTIELLASRDPDSDVLRADDRSKRNGILSVATANFRRMEEALRTLEETSLSAQDVLSDLRFKAYALEKKTGRLLGRRTVLASPSVCVIVTSAMVKDPKDHIRRSVEGGAGMIQLREKDMDDKELIDYAFAVREITAQAGSLLIINDRSDIARAVHADGVHVGQNDTGPEQAREILGNDRIVGVSTHSLEEIEAACRQGADYIGFGPVFETQTKQTGRPQGLDALKCAVEASEAPVYAIGGIGPDNIQDVAATGARCAAVCGSVAKSNRPQDIVENILGILTEYKG